VGVFIRTQNRAFRHAFPTQPAAPAALIAGTE
jgi:hypothetical protein